MANQFINKLENLWKKKRFVCVGLDPDWEKIPNHLKKNKKIRKVFFDFNKAIIDTTFDVVCAYKPNSAFYEAYGQEGWRALEDTARYLHKKYPDIPLILDAKRADIGNTNNAYATAFFDVLGFDAITVHPYLGQEAIQPFLDRKDKGIIVLVRTSNKGAGEFQDLKVGKTPLYKIVAKKVAEEWNKNGNCCVVVGATYPKELKEVRKIIGDMPILVPGIGTQGGDLISTIKLGQGAKNFGLIINSARVIIYASSGKDFAKAARIKTLELNTQIINNISK